MGASSNTQNARGKHIRPCSPPSTTSVLPVLSTIHQEVGAAPSGGGASRNTCKTAAWGRMAGTAAPCPPPLPPSITSALPPPVRGWEHPQCVGLGASSDSQRSTAGIDGGFPGCAVPRDRKHHRSRPVLTLPPDLLPGLVCPLALQAAVGRAGVALDSIARSAIGTQQELLAHFLPPLLHFLWGWTR